MGHSRLSLTAVPFLCSLSRNDLDDDAKSELERARGPNLKQLEL